MYDCGEKPGKGRYKCLTENCSEVITLDDDTDKLPPCNLCNGCNWEKL